MPEILIVDDDQSVRDLLTMYLKKAEFEVRTAADGAEALAAVSEKAPDLVILDIMLPGKSGFLVLEQLRQKIPRDKAPKTIMITGNQGHRHRQYAEALGVSGYLNKPFRMERLLEMVEKLLAG